MSGAAAWAHAAQAGLAFAVDPAGLGGIVLRVRAGPARDVFVQALQALLPPTTPWLKLPIGCSEDRLIGGADIAAALAARRLEPQPGLLARADGGVLMIAQAERLAPARAANIAAALDEGFVRLERDGFSRIWPARLAVLALDEGVDAEAPPPALLERLGLWVDLDGVALRDALAFTADIAAARARLPQTAIDDADRHALAAAAAALGADSLRATLFAARTAKALAALAGRDRVVDDDLAAAAALVLSPRATQARADAPPPDTPTSPPDRKDDSPAPSPTDPQALDDMVIAAALGAVPERVLAALAAAGGAKTQSGGGAGAQRIGKKRGRPIGVRVGDPRSNARLALIDTLRAAAPWQRVRGAREGEVKVTRGDLRVRRFAERREASVIFIVDASGSAAFQRLAEVKGAIELILAQAYVARTHVALVAFRKTGAEVLLAPTRALARARACLAGLPGGGATPLAAGLDVGFALSLAERAKGRSVLAILMSDGRANVSRDGAAGRAHAQADAQAAAAQFRTAGLSSVFVDTGRWPEPDNQVLAAAMGARYAPLPFADARGLSAIAAP
ncbi:MAG: magnesium chelatase subunit D [Caulobacterales bacterium]